MESVFCWKGYLVYGVICKTHLSVFDEIIIITILRINILDLCHDVEEQAFSMQSLFTVSLLLIILSYNINISLHLQYSDIKLFRYDPEL